MLGGGSVMVWGGISMQGRTDLYRVANSKLTVIGYWDEFLGSIDDRPHFNVVGPGAGQCPGPCVRVCTYMNMNRRL